MNISIKFSAANGGEFLLHVDGVLVGIYTAERLQKKVAELVASEVNLHAVEEA